MLNTLITVAAVFAFNAAFTGCANKALSALAGACAIDAIQADAVSEAGIPRFPWAGLALLPKETCAALPGLQTKKCCAEDQGSQRGSKHVAAVYCLLELLLGGGEL